MATVPFRPRGRKSLYVRLVIPLRLRHHFKYRSQVWRSLKTMDRTEASWKGALIEARGRRLFHLLTVRGAHMNQADIDKLVSSWLERALGVCPSNYDE